MAELNFYFLKRREWLSDWPEYSGVTAAIVVATTESAARNHVAKYDRNPNWKSSTLASCTILDIAEYFAGDIVIAASLLG